MVAVSCDAVHEFTKPTTSTITLVAGLGVEGDAHLGRTVQHRSRVRRDPTQPNLRQVHLLHEELFTELGEVGFTVRPGELSENVTTRGIDLLGLPTGTLLHLGRSAIVEVTGLRNPCSQIEDFQPGLLVQVVGRAADGSVIRKAGVMSVVIVGGDVHANDPIAVELPAEPYVPLAPV